MWKDVGCAGVAMSALQPHDITIEEVKRLSSTDAVKRCNKNDFMSHPTPHAMHPMRHGTWQLYSKWAQRLMWGLSKLRVRRQNPPIGSEPLRATRSRDKVTQRMASNWCTRCPIEGTQHPQASYLSPNQEVSFAPLHVGWHRAVRVFC
jgi:hypothetical protein